MRKHLSNGCKLCLCLVTESTNWARMRTVVTAALQRQYSQTELIFWITLVFQVVGIVAAYTEWPKKMYTLFTHQYLWNKFK